MTQWAKLAHKPCDSSSIPRTLIKVEEENQLHSCPLSSTHMLWHHPPHIHTPHTYTETQTNQEIKSPFLNCFISVNSVSYSSFYSVIFEMYPINTCSSGLFHCPVVLCSVWMLPTLAHFGIFHFWISHQRSYIHFNVQVWKNIGRTTKKENRTQPWLCSWSQGLT